MSEKKQGESSVFHCELEQACLSSCFHDPQAIVDTMEFLQVEDWGDVRHKLIFSAILELAVAHSVVTTTLVIDQLKATGRIGNAGGIPYLQFLGQGTALNGHLKDHLVRVKRWSKCRIMQDLLSDSLVLLRGEEPDPEEVSRSLEKQLYHLYRESLRSRPEALGEYISRSIGTKGIDSLVYPKSTGDGIDYRTGIDRLDRFTGGFHRNEVWLLGARPGIGKTSLVTQIAVFNAVRNKPVFIFSPEMTKEGLLLRIAIQHTGISYKKYINESMNKEETSQMKDAFYWAASLPIYIDDSKYLTATDICLRARRMLDEHGAQLAIGDYIQLVGQEDPRHNDHQRISDAMRKVEQSAGEIGAWMWTAQLKRPYGKDALRKPDITDFKESGKIEESAYLAFFLWRQAIEKARSEDNPRDPSGDTRAEFLIRKFRNGPSYQDIPVQFHPYRVTFEDSPHWVSGVDDE